MNPDQQRILIAEACGWRRNSDDPSPSWSQAFLNPSGAGYFDVTELPDYPNDLNSMHEAERGLTGFQWPQYVTLLCGLTSDRDGEGLVFSTAAQRAEAFLRTIGKWKDE